MENANVVPMSLDRVRKYDLSTQAIKDLPAERIKMAFDIFFQDQLLFNKDVILKLILSQLELNKEMFYDSQEYTFLTKAVDFLNELEWEAKRSLEQ